MSFEHLLTQCLISTKKQRKRRITQEDIDNIRKQLQNGVKQEELAKLFHCSRSTISAINRGTYNIYTKESHSERFQGQNNGRSVLNETQVLAIRAEREKGQSYHKLGLKYGVSKAAIRNICLRISWKHLE